MRREASRLRQHALSLEDAIGELIVWKGPGTDAARPAIVASWEALRATADVLDEAGGALQRYATDLAEGHELGRRAELRVHSAGLLLDGTRVIEPWARPARRRPSGGAARCQWSRPGSTLPPLMSVALEAGSRVRWNR